MATANYCTGRTGPNGRSCNQLLCTTPAGGDSMNLQLSLSGNRDPVPILQKMFDGTGPDFWQSLFHGGNGDSNPSRHASVTLHFIRKSHQSQINVHVKQVIALRDGGRCEIRTHESLAALPVFKTGAFNRSANLPDLTPLR